ncbi:hypothetical protein BST81_09090 [Leptolyngbya sp. 'hensonii']|nr:hypothetical protein BST81_09090 [Leptolyngbya sp. 'hensonii']
MGPDLLKQPGLFNEVVDSFRQVLSSLPDKRTGRNTPYGMEDAALSAFSLFFTQTPPFLVFRQENFDGSKTRKI